MQQTETLKLNLIEGGDTVDPQPINENFQTVEGETSAIRSEVAALAANLGSAGQNARIATGSYKGTSTYGVNNPNTLTFDFKPIWVMVTDAYESDEELHLLRPNTHPANGAAAGHSLTAVWGDNSVSWYSSNSTSGVHYQYNNGVHTYMYLALGVDE